MSQTENANGYRTRPNIVLNLSFICCRCWLLRDPRTLIIVCSSVPKFSLHSSSINHSLNQTIEQIQANFYNASHKAWTEEHQENDVKKEL